MAGLYQRWAADGAAFHYVSSSPWQLYEPLAQFARDAGFPEGVFHMKKVRLKDRSILRLFDDPFDTKPPVIRELLERYPHRRFILVGDSGEKDPEVYGAIARQFPEQVMAIYIRDVTGEDASAQRYRAAFRDTAPETWRVFQSASELRELR
jgi:phosphatidate phosphatase APP1